MDIRDFSEGFSVAGQITADDVAELSEKGIKTLICNRPDGEEFGQPMFQEIADKAKSLGINAIYIPIVPGQAGQAEVDACAKAIADHEGPFLAYCRSGARSSVLLGAVKQAAA